MTAALIWGWIAALALTLGAVGGERTAAHASPWAASAGYLLLEVCVATTLALAIDGVPRVSSGAALSAAVIGVAMAAATNLFLAALRSGALSIVVPIVSCDGAAAALIAYATGAPFQPVVGLGLVVMAAGIATLASHASGPSDAERSSRALAVALATAAALAYGLAFYATGSASGVPALWLIVLSRAVALVLVVVLPRDRRWHLPRPALVGVAGMALGSILGTLAFIQAAQTSLPVAAVVASQYAAITVLIGVVLMRDRLLRRDAIAIAALLLSSAVVAGFGG